jgi:hypothetical protein
MSKYKAYWTILFAVLFILIFLLYWFRGSVGELAPKDHPILEIAFWISQSLVPVVALFAMAYAAMQIDESTKMRSAAILQARANFLLQLDERWDSPEISESFIKFYEMRSTAIAEVEKLGLNLSDVAKVQRAADSFPDRLTELRSNKPEEYKRLTLLLGFFETMGVMVKKGYVSDEDMYDLFSGPILEVGKFFRAHIKERNEEMGVLKGLYEHALFLVDRIQAIRARLSVDTP